jgi:hypothetical protein
MTIRTNCHGVEALILENIEVYNKEEATPFYARTLKIQTATGVYEVNLFSKEQENLELRHGD